MRPQSRIWSISPSIWFFVLLRFMVWFSQIIRPHWVTDGLISYWVIPPSLSDWILWLRPQEMDWLRPSHSLTSLILLIIDFRWMTWLISPDDGWLNILISSLRVTSSIQLVLCIVDLHIDIESLIIPWLRSHSPHYSSDWVISLSIEDSSISMSVIYWVIELSSSSDWGIHSFLEWFKWGPLNPLSRFSL